MSTHRKGDGNRGITSAAHLRRKFLPSKHLDALACWQKLSLILYNTTLGLLWFKGSCFDGQHNSVLLHWCALLHVDAAICTLWWTAPAAQVNDGLHCTSKLPIFWPSKQFFNEYFQRYWSTHGSKLSPEEQQCDIVSHELECCFY